MEQWLTILSFAFCNDLEVKTLIRLLSQALLAAFTLSNCISLSMNMYWFNFTFHQCLFSLEMVLPVEISLEMLASS